MQITVSDLFDGVTAETSPVTITVIEGTATTGGGGVSDHGALTGLGDDDHTQYHTDARGDARYDALGDADAAQTAAEATAASALTTHAGAVNPHPTYLTAAEGDAAYDALGAAAAAQAAAVQRANHTGSQAISTVTGLQTALDDKAPLASPALSGNPTAPTQSAGNNTTRLATTAYVQTEAGLLVPKSLVDAKGDLFVGSAADTVARLAVGTDGHVLTADAASTNGVKWAASAGGGGSALASVTAIGSGSGDYAAASVTMVDVDAALSAVIAAVAGDVLIATFACYVYSSLTSFMELGLNIGGTLRRSNGITCGASAVPVLVQVRYVVQSGDISGGNVTVKPQWKKASGTLGMGNDTADRKPTLIVMNTLQ